MQNMREGTAWLFGDNVDTDVIIPAKYLVASNEVELVAHCFEGLDPTLASRIHPGDIIVAGRNFGCGSSREHAPLAIKGLGVSGVVAASYGQIFYRNAFNLGLPLLEAVLPPGSVRSGDCVAVDFSTGRVTNRTTGTSYQGRSIPPFMQQLLNAGGLMPYVLRTLRSRQEGAR